MDIEVLRSFVKVAIEKNMSVAAKELYVSQSTLSRRIQELEKSTGCVVLRRGIPLELTVAGRRLLPLAEAAVAAYDDFELLSAELKREEEQVIRIQEYSFSQIGFSLLSRSINYFSEEHPYVLIECCEYPPRKRLFDTVLDGTLDIGFVNVLTRRGEALPLSLPEGVGAKICPQLQTHLGIAAKKDNPTVTWGDSSLESFAKTRFITPADIYYDEFRKSFADVCQSEGGFVPRFDFRPLASHRLFYASDPKDSAYIIGVPSTGEFDIGIFPDDLKDNLVFVEFPDLEFSTYVLYSKNNANERVLELIDLLSREDEGCAETWFEKL